MDYREEATYQKKVKVNGYEFLLSAHDSAYDSNHRDVLCNGIKVAWLVKNDPECWVGASGSWEWHSWMGADWDKVGISFDESEEFLGYDGLSNNGRTAFYEFVNQFSGRDADVFADKMAAIRAHESEYGMENEEQECSDPIDSKYNRENGIL